MAKNPVEEFLTEKKAFNMGGMAQKAAPVAKRLAEGAGMGIATGVGAAGFAGLTIGAGKLYAAATKTRDFNRMMEANPDLRTHQERNPSGFNRMFSSLRTMAPEFTQEPLVAGAYMRTGMEGPEEERGLVSVKAMRERQFPKSGPATEAALGGYMKGVGMGGDKRQLTRQDKHVLKPGADGGETLERTEQTHNYYT